MILFKKIFFIIPILLIILEITYFSFAGRSDRLDPSSVKNNSINQIILLLRTAKLSPVQYFVRDYQSEIELSLKKSSGGTFQVILSTTSDPVVQVTALQKLIKIANIKGKDIKFIDLSTTRPYATL
jgi:hypothetical protein